MKTIGLLGGMSWESTASYYQLLNQGVKDMLGGLHSAKLCLQSLDFDDIARLMGHSDWPAITQQLVAAAQLTAAGGADFLMICNNSVHHVAEQIEQSIDIPLLHIVDTTAHALNADEITRVGLLGTRFTMEQSFYQGRLSEKYGITVITPDEDDRAFVHDVIFDELCVGEINPASRDRFVQIIAGLQQQGVQAVILGCTELPLLIQQHHVSAPLYDTTKIHCEAAIQLAMTGA